MQSHTELQLDNIRYKALMRREQDSGNSSAGCDLSEFELTQGKIIVSAKSGYFALIEIIEYSLIKEVQIGFSINEPSFYMSINLNNADAVLGYRPIGRYMETLLPGNNKIMFITLKTDWFVYKCKNVTEFKPLITPFCRGENKKVNLATVGIGASLFKTFNSFKSKLNEFDDGYFFVNGCIEKYYKRIKGRNNTNLYHNDKALKIAQYVNEHFRTDLVENMANLLEVFMVSERNMARLAKLAFGRPLHEQIIKLRMEYGMDLLLTTDLPIKEIAVLSGYKDPHYFSKAFKKYVGETPKTLKISNINTNIYEMQK